jgi:hypothetical protein
MYALKNLTLNLVYIFEDIVSFRCNKKKKFRLIITNQQFSSYNNKEKKQ